LAKSPAKIGLVAILIAAVCCAVVATHWPALNAKALSFDDQQYLQEIPSPKPFLELGKTFSRRGARTIHRRRYYQAAGDDFTDARLRRGGRKDNLAPFHTTSLILHTANTALIIVLLYLLFGNIWAAAAGLLFGVHPMTVEPIPWVGERKNLIGRLLRLLVAHFLCSLCAYRTSQNSTSPALRISPRLDVKPTSTPLPAVMLLMDYWPLSRPQ